MCHQKYFFFEKKNKWRNKDVLEFKSQNGIEVIIWDQICISLKYTKKKSAKYNMQILGLNRAYLKVKGIGFNPRKNELLLNKLIIIYV